MIQTYWNKLNPIFREHLISAGQTFIATFLTVLGAGIVVTGHWEWDASAVSAAILAALRAALKEAWARLIPASFGGRKK